MIDEYFLPQPLPEKLKNRFSQNTLKIGEYGYFEGFVVSIPNSQNIRNLLWKKLSPIIGDFSIKGITPFPSPNFPLMLVVIPSWLKVQGNIGLFEGRIYDLSQFSEKYGRFLMAEKFEKRNLEEYILKEKTNIDGKKIYHIFDFSFPETSRDVMLSFFLSSAKYSNRVGGCTVTLLNSFSKYYASNFKELKGIVKEIHPILKSKSMSVSLLYDEPLNIKISLPMKIKYESLGVNKAKNFYIHRNAKVWEMSAITDTSIKMETLIGSSELPFIPYPEETQVDDYEIKEYSVDIASYVISKHIENPEIDRKNIEPFKERILRKIDEEFPILSEAMKMGIIMDIADVNGFGEHLARLIDSWKRVGFTDPSQKILEIYTTLFDRIVDILQDRLKKEISALSEKKRFERTINRVLWELNVLKPEGWDFFYFQKKLDERGITKNPEKIIMELIDKGIVIEKDKNLFLAVEKV